MAYLYLNFVDHIDSKNESWDDFFVEPLRRQFDKIANSLGGLAFDTLEKFIYSIFPADVEMDFYISFPGFNRTVKEKKDRDQRYLENIVIRPGRHSGSDYALPKNRDLLLVGDLTLGKVNYIAVKGIELVEADVQKFGEVKVKCKVACAFEKKQVTNRTTGKTFMAPNYSGNIDLHNPVLTNDFIIELCEKHFPVPHPEKAIKILEQWEKYLDFREYYLDERSKQCEEVDGVYALDSYLLTKEEFEKDRRRSSLVLDGIPQFGEGGQVIVSQNVGGAESFPLIRVEIRKNRKEALAISHIGNGKPNRKFESYLNRFTNDNVELSQNSPESRSKDKGWAYKSYQLGERYLFTHVDEEPDCSLLEKDFNERKAKELAAIAEKHESLIKSLVDSREKEIRPGLEDKYRKLYEGFAKSLDEQHAKEASENRYDSVKAQYEKEVLGPIRRRYEERRLELEKKLRKCKEPDKRKEISDDLSKLGQDFDRQLADAKSETPIALYCEEHYRSLKRKKGEELEKAKNAELEELLRAFRAEQQGKYEPNKKKQLAEAEKEWNERLEKEKERKIEEETVRCYKIYFRPNADLANFEDIKSKIKTLAPKYLCYDPNPERMKLKRQERALKSINDGCVRNPFLATYLFAPETLSSKKAPAENVVWFLESLNERQKTAVKKALASESLFLLQGPPGTGKTQVIAELTAQLVKRGKKVLISSETHKAIDNVFERLPKIPEIRPLRLIPSQSKKVTNYGPERLVDNFYNSIADTLSRQIDRYERFHDAKDHFAERMKSLQVKYGQLCALEWDNASLESERSKLRGMIRRLKEERDRLRYELLEAKKETELWTRTKANVDNLVFSSEDVDAETMKIFSEKCQILCGEFDFSKEIDLADLNAAMAMDIETIRRETAFILSNGGIAELESHRDRLRDRMAQLRDPVTDDPPEKGAPGYEEYNDCREQLIKLKAEIDKANETSGANLSNTHINKFFKAVLSDNDAIARLPNDFVLLKGKLKDLLSETDTSLESQIESHRAIEGEIESRIFDNGKAISEDEQRYEELGESDSLVKCEDLKSLLIREISGFLKDFDIVGQYDPLHLGTAFDLIEREWNRLDKDYAAAETENKKKIPIYREIAKYLRQKDVIEDDRREFTRELYEHANVFGLTCTSGDKFNKGKMNQLESYGIEEVDVKAQGIDVVIVDEVSKSSFLDLLIPVLYGKTIVLVGDHRQLPPVYDLRHLRQEDFESLDKGIIDKKKNDDFTVLYETCFFKTLYEKVPEDFRIMLNRQYRCHSQIMDVFNHFYGGSRNGLMLGTTQQDNEKEHGLTVKIRGTTIIDPQHHVYFVDCEKNESSAYEGSTSKINKQEADVALALLKALDEAPALRVSSGKVRVDPSTGVAERPSIGVICTYGDQATRIKKAIRKQKFRGFSDKPDERLVISTVDDFQGDERDIILVSMVRNPAGSRYDADFIKKFERINVALSRARKLLIVIGSKDFLERAGVIDLPDLSGNPALDKKNWPIFKKIIETIDFRGKVLSANDILME